MLAHRYQTENNSPPYYQRTKTIKEELESASPMNINSSTKKQQKSRKVDGRRTCNCPHPRLLDQMVLGRAKCKGEVLLNGPKTMSPRRQVKSECISYLIPIQLLILNFSMFSLQSKLFLFMHNNLNNLVLSYEKKNKSFCSYQFLA